MQEVNRTSVIKRISLVNKSLVEVVGIAVICSIRTITRSSRRTGVFFAEGRGGSMKKVGLAVLAFAGLFTSLGVSQQPQSAQPQNSKQRAADLNLGDAPTPVDMYCSGFITTEKVPDKLFVAV